MGIKEQRRAEGIVHALTDQDSCTCSDCGEEIDVSDATDPMSVVVRLEQHRKQCREASCSGDRDE
jgi:hypothetical protein